MFFFSKMKIKKHETRKDKVPHELLAYFCHSIISDKAESDNFFPVPSALNITHLLRSLLFFFNTKNGVRKRRRRDLNKCVMLRADGTGKKLSLSALSEIIE